MGRFTIPTLVTAALSIQAVLGADLVKCGKDSKCPEDTPCCSQYGECGTGAYCLGGCDPLNSFEMESCVPAPVCESKTYKWDNLDNVQKNTKYLGDASKADWVSSGEPLTNNGELIMTMPSGSVGTLLANNHYVWYGKASARMKTSRGAGVITAFIFLSDVKDEIDYEWVGVDLQTAQTNYYFQGILDYENGENATVSGDTFEEFHTYEIDWQPEKIVWSIDGTVQRTVNKADTFNAKTNKFEFPQSPSRVQLSLWPGGLASNAKGTIEWAGGEIDWQHEDIKNHGYYYATVDEVTIECYDPPANARIEGDVSYIFSDESATNDTVVLTDKPTVLKSFQATGTDMDVGDPKSSDSPDDDDDDDDNSGSPADGTVPGQHGGGSGSQADNGGDDSGWTPPEPTTTGFSQNDQNGNSAPSQGEHVLRGSLFAVLVAVVVLVTM
jgi:beta-glucanase (GH16 family)